MDAEHVRVGVLLSPIIPLWSGTVVSYDADTFDLEVTSKTGITAALVGWFIDNAGRFVRIRKIDVSGANAILTLAPNGLSFAALASVNIYNVLYPSPKYQRVATNVVTWTGGVPGQFSDWRFTGTGGYTTLYWKIDGSHNGKLLLFSDSSMDEDSKVASDGTSVGAATFGPKNNSGVQGSVTINDITWGSGEITIEPYILYKDYDITYQSLGGTTDERSRAAQGPIVIVNPECVNADIAEHFTLSAVGSFATYDGSNVPGTIRYPATIAATDYVWAVDVQGTIHSGQNSPTASISFSAAGFRYVKLTITDSNAVSQVRYIPVWVGITPYAVESASVPWSIDRDLSIELEFMSPPVFLRHTLVCLVDLDTRECLYLGYAWPASVEYDYEKSTLRLTAYQALSFLRNVYYYPFIITGVKGGSISWDYFEMYSCPRGAYFLLRWHSNYLDIANAEFDVRTTAGPPVSPPGALAAENRLRYIQGFSAGTLYDELGLMAREAFYSIYPLPLGGFSVIPSLLYGSTITGTISETGVNSNSITQVLTSADMVVPVQKTLSTPSMSETTMWGFYHNAALDVYPIKVKAPIQPEPYGRPNEIPNLLASPVASIPGDPGYYEILRWAGRHVGVTNYSDTYVVRPRQDASIKAYPMVDIPDPNNPLATVRIVVESKTVTFNPDGHADIEVTGRSFGVTVSSIVAPSDPIPTTNPPGPIPVPDVLIADFVAVPVYGFADLIVQFTDLSTSSGDPITTWEWDFGDTYTDTVQNPSHTYTVPGLYTVTLTVTTATGSTDTEVKIEYIEVVVPTPLALVVNPTQSGLTLDYKAFSVEWIDLKQGALLGANVGSFINATLSGLRRAWLLTSGAAHPDDNGVWYCPDISIPPYTFTLVLSHTDYSTLIGVPGSLMASLGCDGVGVAYASGTANVSGFGRYAFGTNVGAWAKGTDPNIPTDGFQFALGSSPTDARLGCGAGGVPQYSIFSLSGGTPTRVYNVLGQGAPAPVVPGYFVHDIPAYLYEYTDTGSAGQTPTPIYTPASPVHPIISRNFLVLSIHGTTGDLMDFGTTFDTALHAFGVPLRDFGGMCIGQNGDVLAASNAPNVATDFLKRLPDGDTLWLPIEGDWVAVMGGNWYGGLGAGEMCSVVMTL